MGAITLPSIRRRRYPVTDRFAPLRELLHPVTQWTGYPTDAQEETARTILLELREALKALPPDRDYQLCSDGLHLGYVEPLARIRLTLHDGRYRDACVELDTLLHFQPVGQPRIRDNLIVLLTDALPEKRVC